MPVISKQAELLIEIEKDFVIESAFCLSSSTKL